ncbi:MAG TPA: hypothetical protein VFS15_18415 [Kofleriaceae bacterium]|nr:hypothetical protein [Kofleriaceae bacterium]
MQRILLPVAVALGLLAGCYTQGDVGVGYSYGYAAPAPSMYYVSPGVSVVAYSDYPVFYSDNYYWRYDGGIWYRSSYYNGGWVVWNDVPYSVRRIDRPYRYARYNPGRWSRDPYRGPAVRDHRTYQPGYDARYRSAAPAPGVRDHRTYQAPRTAPVQAPTVRDHRDYTAPRPTYRSSGPSRPAPRDHRR